MSEERQTGQTVEEKQPELKETDLQEPKTTKFEIEEKQSEGNVARDEQNLSEGNLERDITNYPVAQLMRMAKMQMVESEMEKKYLLYHILRQNLEMKRMKRQMGIMPEFNDTLDSLRLTDIPPLFPPAGQIRRLKAQRDSSSFVGRDCTYDGSFDGGFSNEDLEAWRIANKIPCIPEASELGPKDHLWSDAAMQMPQMNEEFIGDDYDLGNLYDNWDENQVAAWLYGNQGQGGNAINPSWDEKFSQHQKFNVELFKTEICRSWAKFGLCPYGLSCRFAHGPGELRVRPKPHWKYKTEMCKKYLAGYCPYGSRCYFVHKPEEAMTTEDRPLGVELQTDQNVDMTRRWQRTSIGFHPYNAQERM